MPREIINLQLIGRQPTPAGDPERVQRVQRYVPRELNCSHNKECFWKTIRTYGETSQFGWNLLWFQLFPSLSKQGSNCKCTHNCDYLCNARQSYTLVCVQCCSVSYQYQYSVKKYFFTWLLAHVKCSKVFFHLTTDTLCSKVFVHMIASTSIMFKSDIVTNTSIMFTIFVHLLTNICAELVNNDLCFSTENVN